MLNGFQHSKNLLSARQYRSKINLVNDDAVTRVHGICSLRVMGSFPGILFPSSFNYLSSEKPFVLLIFPTSLSFRLGTVIHTLLSSHLSNLRIDVVASKGDFVVTFEEKTLILWDMNAGVQKATFNADKVGTSLLRRGLLLCPREVGEREN